jgi:ABC-type ATPase with predicted acetyltransferase domain
MQINMKKNRYIISEPIKITLYKSASDLLKYLSKDVQKEVYQYINNSAYYVVDNFYNHKHGILFEFSMPIKDKLEYGYVAFWDRENKENHVVIISHGFARVGDKIPEYKYKMFEDLKQNYFKTLE